MKKGQYGLLLFMFLIMIGCQNQAQPQKSPLEKKIDKGNVVIVLKSENILDIITKSETKIYNLDKMFTFMNNTHAGKDSKIKITYVDTKGKMADNVLTATDSRFIFENNFKRVVVPGTYHCDRIDLYPGPPGVALSGCDGPREDYISVVPYSTQDFREAKAIVKIKK